MEYEFEENINEIRKLFQKKPKKVNYELRKIINYLEKNDSGSLSDVFREIKWDILLICISVIMIVILGFFAEEIALYYFGLAFFLAGVFIGLFIDRFGLLFLFSHGISGLCLMEWSLIAGLIRSPRFTDGISIFNCYSFVVIIIFVVATIITIIYNLSDTAKKMKWIKLIPILLYSLGFLLTTIVIHTI